MNSMMEQTLISGTARKAEIQGWQAAGKTGTSQDFRDAWFIGYTSHLVAGVWLGNDDNSPTKKTTGGGLPVEVWSRFMHVALQGVQPTPLPNAPSSNAQPSGPLATLAQIASQVTAPAPSAAMPSAPQPANNSGRPSPTRAAVRPEADAGLDGWLIQRLFGR
jgi:penicillin-binding protein 1A